MDKNKYRLLVCLIKFYLKKYSKQGKIWENSDSKTWELYSVI